MKLGHIAIVLGACGGVLCCRGASDAADAQGNAGTGAVVVALSTDDAPAGIDGFELVLQENGSVTVFDDTYALSTDTTLPGTLTLAAGNGGVAGPNGSLSPGRVSLSQPSQTFTLVVRGKLSGADVMVRTAVFTMPASGVKRLDLRLEQACAGVKCPGSEQTCIGGGCATNTVDTATLPEN